MIGKPNILWICTDQQRYDTIHALGNERIRTPNLDRLCAQGVAFNRAYCQSPVCTPSRASFLTGQYPGAIHVPRNGNAYFPGQVPLLTKRLADAGYNCGLIGKLHLASAWNRVERRTEEGYRVFKYSHAPFQGIGKGNQYTDWLVAHGVDLDTIFMRDEHDEYSAYRPDVAPTLHQTTWCANEAIQFIKGSGDTPWLLSVNIFDPHPPFDAPRSYRERYPLDKLEGPHFRPDDLETQARLENVYFQNKARTPAELEKRNIASYYGMITLIDEQVGRILATLEATGRRENTIVIFMSDHGETLGDHGLTAKGCRFYEGLVRVPLIWSWPGHFAEGRKCDDLVELNDIAPTLAELCGICLERTHGYSLLPYLRGGEPEAPRRFVRCEYLDAMVPFESEAPAPEHQPTYGTMYYDGRYKLSVYHAHGLGELYDLQNDPHEFEDLWDDPAARGLKLELIEKSFNTGMTIADPGPPLSGPY